MARLIQGVDFSKVTIVDGLTAGLDLKAGATNASGQVAQVFGGNALASIEKTILQAIDQAKLAGNDAEANSENTVLLVLDGLDFMLAATGFPVRQMMDMLSGFREVSPFFIASLTVSSPSNPFLNPDTLRSCRQRIV